MELTRGRDARRAARRRARCPLDEVLRYGVEIADALDRAHRAGIVHRDLKPGQRHAHEVGRQAAWTSASRAGCERPRSRARLAHAVATMATPLTAEGTIVGTFQYMAPEQLEGQEADARTDIWALGGVLYEMATGRGRSTGKSRTSLIAAIISQQPPPISSVAADEPARARPRRAQVPGEGPRATAGRARTT